MGGRMLRSCALASHHQIIALSFSVIQSVALEVYLDARMDPDSQQASSRMFVGRATVDTTLLKLGLPEVYGWYHVYSKDNKPVGQLLVRTTSVDPISIDCLTAEFIGWP